MESPEPPSPASVVDEMETEWVPEDHDRDHAGASSRKPFFLHVSTHSHQEPPPNEYSDKIVSRVLFPINAHLWHTLGRGQVQEIQLICWNRWRYLVTS